MLKTEKEIQENLDAILERVESLHDDKYMLGYARALEWVLEREPKYVPYSYPHPLTLS